MHINGIIVLLREINLLNKKSMKSETSNDLIGSVGTTVIIASDCGHGLTKDQDVSVKLCRKCGRKLPTSEFYLKKKSKDGLQDFCKECHKEANKARYVERKKAKSAFADKVVTETKVVDTHEHSMTKVYSDPELSKFTPRQLMAELKARGFRWEYMLEPQRKVYFNKI